MTKKNRFLAVLLTAAVVFVMLFSVLFIAMEADHDCTGEDCPICYQISVCENTLKSVGQVVLLVVLAAFSDIFISLPSFSKRPADNTTLVTLKVKLSN